MATFPEPISALSAALGKLPGIGPRTAERLALHVVQTEIDEVRQLAHLLITARERIQNCPVCGALTETTPCAVCSNPQRDSGLICIVERPIDIISIEKAGTYRGKYHVLGGRISPVNGIAAEDLRIGELEKRLANEPVREIIIALGTDVEGDATSHYLAKRLATKGVFVSRIAHGLPAGSGLEFADQLTLSQALEGRREIS